MPRWSLYEAWALRTEGMSKSVHMTCIHSCGHLGLFLGGSVLDRCGDLRCIIELGEPGLPGSMLCEGLLDLLHQSAEALPLMMPGALVVHIAAHPLQGVGTRTVWRYSAERKPRVTGA